MEVYEWGVCVHMLCGTEVGHGAMGRLVPPSPPSCLGVLMCGEQHILAVTNIGFNFAVCTQHSFKGCEGGGV